MRDTRESRHRPSRGPANVTRALLAALWAAACGSGQSAAEGASEPTGRACASTLPRVQAFDAQRAARGEALLRSGTLAPGILPEGAVRLLWIAWGTPEPSSDEQFWTQVRERYGMLEAPFDNAGLPLGFRREPAGLTFNCLLCHTGRVAGTTLIGAPNSTVDLESFFDDLKSLRDLAVTLGLQVPPIPYDLNGFTSAAGAHDAFGLGFRFYAPALPGGAGVNTDFGPQRSPAWWLLHDKSRIFVDGSADASGHRTMMATLVAFGVGYGELGAREEQFVDIAHYIRSLEPPCWELTALDGPKLHRGQSVFERECVHCHGMHTGPDARFPDNVVSVGEVGTDAIRAQRFGPAEANVLNLSWFGEPPLKSTGGYLAQPLVGIWARAPYFHNGSVPDLMGVLDPTQRPARWRRIGGERDGYDAERVGFRYEVVSEAPANPGSREGRLVYDTAREGMSNGGHAFGASLTDAERSDLLEYLRSL
jgi:hypothetical protein